jgi:hypothetical protein
MDCSGGEEEAQVMSAEEKRERRESAREREREKETTGVGPKNATNGFSFDPVHTGVKSGILSHNSRTKSPPSFGVTTTHSFHLTPVHTNSIVWNAFTQ